MIFVKFVALHKALVNLFAGNISSTNCVFTVTLKDVGLQYHYFLTLYTRGRQIKRIRMPDIHFVCLEGKAFFGKRNFDWLVKIM